MSYVIQEFVTKEQVETVFSIAFQGLKGSDLSYWKKVLACYLRELEDFEVFRDGFLCSKEVVTRVVADALNHSESSEKLVQWASDLERWIREYDKLCDESARFKKEKNILTPVYFISKTAGNPDFDYHELITTDGRIELGDDFKTHTKKDVFTYFCVSSFREEDINRMTAVFLLSYAREKISFQMDSDEQDQATYPLDSLRRIKCLVPPAQSLVPPRYDDSKG